MQARLGESIWVVIAAFNEAAVIARVVSELVQFGYRVMVIDDGSIDNTGATAASVGALVVAHPTNLGQGAALRTGIELALQNNAEYIVTFDADGQHRASDIDSLIRSLLENDVDFALGSRFLGSFVVMPLSRRVLLKVATWFTRLTTGLQVTDTHNGLRAMTRHGASRIRLRQNRMAHASEFLHEIARTGLGYVEVPTTIEYSPYSLAKGQRFSDLIRILFDLSTKRTPQ